MAARCNHHNNHGTCNGDVAQDTTTTCTESSSQTTTMQPCMSLPTENLPILPPDDVSDSPERQDPQTDGRQTATVSSQTQMTLSFQDVSDTEVGCCGIKRRKKLKDYTLLKKKEKRWTAVYPFGRFNKKKYAVLPRQVGRVLVAAQLDNTAAEMPGETKESLENVVALNACNETSEDSNVGYEDLDKTSQISCCTEDTSDYTVSKCECDHGQCVQQENTYPTILTNQYVPDMSNYCSHPFSNFYNPVHQPGLITNPLAQYNYQHATKCSEEVAPVLPAAVYDISGLVYNVGGSSHAGYRPAQPGPIAEAPSARCCRPASPDFSEVIQVSEQVSVAIPTGPWIVNGSGSPFRGGMLAASRSPTPRQHAGKTRQRLRIVPKS